MKNPFRKLTLADEADIAITRLRRQLLQLQLERIDHDRAIDSLCAKIEHLSRVTNGDTTAGEKPNLVRQVRSRNGKVPDQSSGNP